MLLSLTYVQALKRNDKIQNDKTVDMKQVGHVWEANIDKLLRSASPVKEQMFMYDFIASPQDDAPEHPTELTRAFATVRFAWDVVRFRKCRQDESGSRRDSYSSLIYKILTLADSSHTLQAQRGA